VTNVVSTGGCHCGRVRFEVRGAPVKAIVCNCSICTKKAYLHWIVPEEDVRVVAGEGELTTYTFNTGVAKHRFCRVCGCAPFYTPRSDPDKVDVNVRCLEGVDMGALEIETFDGQNWEAHYEIYRART
jgi:hypothetical protein